MQKKDNTIRLTKYLIFIYVIVLFSFQWITYYNNFAFHGNKDLGCIVSIVIYGITYSYFSRLYRANKVGSFSVLEIIFSQFLALCLSNLILFVECCLIANRYVSVVPMMLMFVMQYIGAVIWAVFSKRYFIQYIPPTSTLLIYGDKNCQEFLYKLKNKYNHLFSFQEVICYRDKTFEEIREKINAYETIILYEVTGAMRTPIMEYCIYCKKNIYVTPRIADIVIEGFDKRHLIDTPLLKYEYHYRSRVKQVTKRGFDVIITSMGILLSLLPMTLIAIAIKREDGGPILFKQKRCTRDEKIFEIYKFRSMIVDAENGAPIPCKQSDDRITRVGRIIRRFRLDELPQLFNILKGDMSLVGPRPERIEHVQKYTEELPEFKYRSRVKAGLTGYAQIYGKYNTSPYEKLKLDLMYIENQSLLLDFKMLMLTVKTIFIPESTEGFSEETSRLIEKGLSGIYEK